MATLLKSKKAAKKAAPAAKASIALKDAKISLPQAQKLLKAKAKTLASVPGRSKVLRVNEGGTLAVVKKNKKSFEVVVSTNDLKEAVEAYNKIK
jgi:hypothetical protein